MMVAEFGPSHYRKVYKGWLIAAAVSAGMGACSIREGIKYSNSPDNRQYQELATRVQSLEGKLFDEGTLGSDGGLLVRYLEIRNSQDPRLLEWGQLKNQLDKQTVERQKSYQSSFVDMAKKIGVLAGPIFALFSLQNARWARRKALGFA